MLEYKSGGYLELQKRYRAPVTWTSDYGAQRACPKAWCISIEGLELTHYSVLFPSYGGAWGIVCEDPWIHNLNCSNVSGQVQTRHLCL